MCGHQEFRPPLSKKFMLSRFCFERFHNINTDKYFNNYSLQVSFNRWWDCKDKWETTGEFFKKVNKQYLSWLALAITLHKISYFFFWIKHSLLDKRKASFNKNIIFEGHRLVKLWAPKVASDFFSLCWVDCPMSSFSSNNNFISWDTIPLFRVDSTSGPSPVWLKLTLWSQLSWLWKHRLKNLPAALVLKKYERKEEITQPLQKCLWSEAEIF